MFLFLKVDGQPQKDSLDDTQTMMMMVLTPEMVAIDIIKKLTTMKMSMMMTMTKGMAESNHRGKMMTTLITKKKQQRHQNKRVICLQKKRRIPLTVSQGFKLLFNYEPTMEIYFHLGKAIRRIL